MTGDDRLLRLIAVEEWWRGHAANADDLGEDDQAAFFTRRPDSILSKIQRTIPESHDGVIALIELHLGGDRDRLAGEFPLLVNALRGLLVNALRGLPVNALRGLRIIGQA